MCPNSTYFCLKVVPNRYLGAKVYAVWATCTLRVRRSWSRVYRLRVEGGEDVQKCFTVVMNYTRIMTLRSIIRTITGNIMLLIDSRQSLLLESCNSKKLTATALHLTEFSYYS